MGRRLLACIVMLLAVGPAAAQTNLGLTEDRVGDLLITRAWAAPSSLSQRTQSIYMTIANNGTQDDRLVAAHSSVSGDSELRSHRTGEVVGRARQVDALLLPAGKTVVLRPGAEYIALIDVEKAQRMGDRVPLLLLFRYAGLLTITVPVMAGPPDG